MFLLLIINRKIDIIRHMVNVATDEWLLLRNSF